MPHSRRSKLILGTTFVLTALLWTVPAAAQHGAPPAQAAKFDAVHIEQSHSIRLAAPAEQVFPLFEPRGISSWATRWKLEVLYPSSGPAGKGAVALTRNEHHAEATVWVVADHDAEARRIRYINVIPAVEAWEMEIHCADDGEGGTQATVTYRVTALSQQANEWVQDFFDNRFVVSINGWADRINTYLNERGH